MNRIGHLRALLGMWIVAAAVSGCDQGPETVPGTYQLRTIGGRVLPTSSSSDANVTYHAGSLTINADGSCTFMFDSQLVGAPRAVSTTACTWDLNGGAVDFILANSSQSGAAGTWANDDLSVTFETSEAWHFRR